MEIDLSDNIINLSLLEKTGVFIVGIFSGLIIVEIEIILGHSFSVTIFFSVLVLLVTILTGMLSGIFLSVITPILWLIIQTLNCSSGLFCLNAGMINAGLNCLCFVMLAVLTSILVRSLNKNKRAAMYDSLTGVVSRRYFENYINNKILRSDAVGMPVTLAYFDLDNFKDINDSFGHDFGDAVLKEYAGGLKKQIRQSDIVARVGGDEFVLLLNNVPENALVPDILNRILCKLNEEMRKTNWKVTTSVGAVTFHQINLSFPDMLKLADNLMYEVKRNGKNNFKHIVFQSEADV